MGVYCFAPRALTHIEPGRRLDFPDLILRLIAAGETVRSWPSDDYWLDIGRHDDYEQAQEEFESVRDRLIPPELAQLAARAERTASTTMSTSASLIVELSGSAQWRSATSVAAGSPSGGAKRRYSVNV